MLSEIIEEEKWTPLLGFEDSHEVSNVGRARSKAGVLSLFTRKSGHVSLHIKKHGKSHCVMLHAAVLASFIGPRPKGNVARHLNGVANDNRLANLAWGTPAENSQDRAQHGTSIDGEKNPRAKLSREQVGEIRMAEATLKELAARYSVSTGTICKIRRGKTWAV